jgi:hypothetical protein
VFAQAALGLGLLAPRPAQGIVALTAVADPIAVPAEEPFVAQEQRRKEEVAKSSIYLEPSVLGGHRQTATWWAGVNHTHL